MSFDAVLQVRFNLKYYFSSFSNPINVNCSYLHKNVNMSFLTCEPNLKHIQDYKDESDIFFDDPVSWLGKNPHLISDATYVLLYENLYNKIYDKWTFHD